MLISDFIESKEVRYTKNIVNADDLAEIEIELGIHFGRELTQYILEYGYLGYKHVELFGINSKQKKESDMVKQTRYLHTYFPKTDNFVAIENAGDGEYIVVGTNDDVYEFSSEDDTVHKKECKLFDYILKRFQEVDVLV